jgi:hypothetical protein
MSEVYSDEEFTTPVVKEKTIGNLENAKRAFFNNQSEEFVKGLESKPYKYYKATYKYWDDYTGRPDFVVRNFNRGMIQNLEDYRKYFLVCFRALTVQEKTYQFESFWVFNVENAKDLLGSFYDDFEWTEISLTDFTDKFNKSSNEYVSEDYLH